ncbi:MAG: hypothetical protein Q9181_005564 [Wetmoreana brouardii]
MDLSKAIADVQKAADADKSGNGQNHVALLEAVRRLSLAAETPAETLMRMRFEPLQSAAIRLALEGGFLDAIAAANGHNITASEIAKKTNYDKLLIIGAILVDYMKKTGFHQFPKKPEQHSPFETVFKMGFFEFFANNEDQRRYLDDYMAVRRQGLSSWHEVFPMASQLVPGFNTDNPDAVLLVDVGGGFGHELRSFHEAHPDAPGRLVVQDLLVMTEKFGGKAPPGIEVMTYDFFTSQPVKGE